MRSLKHHILMLTLATAVAACWSSCTKTQDFYQQLKALPQIDVSQLSAYRLSYVVGDTMTIVGKLQPQNGLKISIGGTDAELFDIRSTDSKTGNQDDHVDYVSLHITPAMAGQDRQVKIMTGGVTGYGPAINILPYTGERSFNTALSSQRIATISNQCRFLYCINGRGDSYYYDGRDQQLKHLDKAGNLTAIKDFSDGLPDGTAVNSFLAGGADPEGRYLYLSFQTGAEYRFYRMDLQTGTLLLLNRSDDLHAPYDGPINSARMIVTGVYPDSRNNIYLAIGQYLGQAPNTTPVALGLYNSATGSLQYIYKNFSRNISDPRFSDMPGVPVNTNFNPLAFRISPDENLLYVISDNAPDLNIEVLDLTARVLVQTAAPKAARNNNGLYAAVAPFANLGVSLGTTSQLSSNIAFGFMPMPNRRLQTLLYQNYAQAAAFGFPRWIVFDFANERTYAYAPGRFQLGASGEYGLRQVDELLNYDEDGNLYTTANGKSYILKTTSN